MDNASKALIIAGGVLLAILVLTLLVAGLNALSNISEEREKAKLAEQVQEFNAQYEAYNKNLLYHTDVMTVINKAIDHNYRGGNPICINVIMSPEETLVFKSKDDEEKIEKLVPVYIEGEDLVEKEFAYYQCIECKYKGPDKRISSMSFKNITSEL